MKKNRYQNGGKALLFALVLFGSMHSFAQHTTKYNLAQLLKDQKFMISPGKQPALLADAQKNAITTHGSIWLKDVNFKEGTIEIDLRGKDIFLKSFLGIAFHAVDSVNYEVIYFRPFNFRHADTLRRKWSVQYMALPEYDYAKLRADHPLQYENAVTPVPLADEWFHASIVVKGDQVTVYVNHSSIPSLTVTKLKTTKSGMIGLWDSDITGDFANLEIRD